jgi:hypothetical protein
MGDRLLAPICIAFLLSPMCEAQDAAAKAQQSVEKIIVGTVVDQAGNPVNGAEVGLQIWGLDEQDRLPESDLVATTFTAPDGSFQLPVPLDLDPKNKLGTVWVISEGSIPSRPGSYGILRGLISRPVKLKTIPDKEVIVRVLDPQGRPAAGVQVKVVSQRIPQSVGFAIPPRWGESVAGTTNDRGEAWIEHALPDAIDGLVFSRKGMADIRLDGDFFLNARPANSGPTFTITLPPTGAINGQLTTASPGAPVDRKFLLQTRSRVTVRQLPAWGEAEVQPDAEGRFRIEGIADGYVVVPAFFRRDEPWRANVPFRMKVNASETLELRVPIIRGVTVRGQIRKGDTKEGVPDFSLAVIYGQSAAENDSMRDRFELKTDPEGRFTAVVPPGAIQLRLHSIPKDYVDVDWWQPNRKGSYGVGRDVPAGVETFDLAPVDLDRSKTLKGQLVDRDGNSLLEWSVYGFPEAAHRPEGSGLNSFGGVDTDKDGRFQGPYPVLFPPTTWKASYREWKTPFEFDDRDFVPKVVTQEPFVLQVDVKKADLKDARKKP